MTFEGKNYGSGFPGDMPPQPLDGRFSSVGDVWQTTSFGDVRLDMQDHTTRPTGQETSLAHDSGSYETPPLAQASAGLDTPSPGYNPSSPREQTETQGDTELPDGRILNASAGMHERPAPEDTATETNASSTPEAVQAVESYFGEELAPLVEAAHKEGCSFTNNLAAKALTHDSGPDGQFGLFYEATPERTHELFRAASEQCPELWRELVSARAGLDTLDCSTPEKAAAFTKVQRLSSDLLHELAKRGITPQDAIDMCK